MLQRVAKACAGLLAASLWLQLAVAHVTLRYPLPGIRNDFLDNVRTDDLCGAMPNRNGDGAAWQLPDFNGTVVTTVQAGQPLDVSWDLHYAHQGGFRIELYDTNLTLIHRWNSSDHWGCNLDSTVQNVTITLPNEPCDSCILRFERQALEWGSGYLFKSCAVLDITAASNPCQGCSGHGQCGAGGTCQCESSLATGFFYGAHCEYENECETDAHCSSNGKCIDTGDESGPSKQCFCENGFFGDVVTRASGMQVRTCDRPSSLTLDPSTVAWDTFGEDYNLTLEASQGTFAAYLNHGNNNTVEIAMKAQSTSWLALGMRSVAAAGDTPAAPAGGTAPAEGEAAPAEGETGAAPAEGDTGPAPAEPAAEDEAASSESPPVPSVPEAEEEAASEGRRLMRARALSEADEDDEATPAAPAEDDTAPAEGDTGATAEGDTGAAAEGDSGSATGVCAAVTTANMFVPGNLGPGFVVTLEEAGEAAAGAGGTPAEGAGGAPAEGEPAAESTPAAASEGDAAPAATAEGDAGRRRRMMGMPAVEAEAAPAAPRLSSRRALLNAAPADGSAAPAEGTAAPAEGSAAPAAEGENAAGGDGEYDGKKGKKIDYTDAIVQPAAAKLGAVSGGPCAGYPTTPASGAHAMVNQDVVFAAAREVGGVQYFRVVDMFTPSRAKPLPDYVFCGQDGVCGSDDIIDAIGVQVGGRTYVKYVRSNVSPDENRSTDVCISDDQNYHVIYAYGQLTAAATHVPNSSLEILPEAAISNTDFYKEDVLKFHGGGIGVQYEGRGTITSSVNLFEEAGAGCEPSTEEGFTCSLARLGGQVIIHYSPFVTGDTSARIAVETPSEDGYVAFAFAGDDPTQMIGATAVIATTSAANGEVGVFALNDRSVGAVNELPGTLTEVAAGRRRLSQDASFTIYDVEIERANGRTIVTFTRDFDDTFDGAAQINALVAYHGSSAALATHDGREPVGFFLSEDGGSVSFSDPLPGQRRTHAILMITGWGVLLPLGVIFANTLRTWGPVWFHIHRVIQIAGLAIASGGIILALLKFELEHSNRHRQLGLTVMILGWLQPFNALIRPHPAKEGEKRPMLRLAWEILHKGVGYLTIVLAIVTIFWGLELGETYEPFAENHDTWRNAYIGILIGLLVLWAALLAMHFWRARKAQSDKASSDGSGGVKQVLDVEADGKASSKRDVTSAGP